MLSSHGLANLSSGVLGSLSLPTRILHPALCHRKEEWGYDALSTDVGTLDAFYYAMPPAYVPAGSTLDLAAEVKKHVSIPVHCGSRFVDEEIAYGYAKEGKEVTIVEALDDILLVNDVPQMNKLFLQDAYEVASNL